MTHKVSVSETMIETLKEEIETLSQKEERGRTGSSHIQEEGVPKETARTLKALGKERHSPGWVSRMRGLGEEKVQEMVPILFVGGVILRR